MVVVPRGIRYSLEHLRLQDLADYPLITYDVGFTGRGLIDEAFRQAGLRTDIVLTAMDSDVIQQYVALGLGLAWWRRWRLSSAENQRCERTQNHQCQPFVSNQ